jgi:signal transduction histidine kinase
LREKTSLSGNDFLPLIVKLDDLFTHMQSIRDLVSRLSRLELVARDMVPPPDLSNIPKPADSKAGVGGEVAAALDQLTQRVARDAGKIARLECVGLNELPAAYRRVVKDIAVQAVRNAVVHGIESPATRVAAGKTEFGTIRIELQRQEDKGYKLTLQDDGQGLVTEKIIAKALEKGLVTPAEAASLDIKGVIKFLFKSGFSTLEGANKDAGRGVGMNLIADLVQQAGGKISIASAAGRYTRFTVTLPEAQQRDADTEAA